LLPFPTTFSEGFLFQRRGGHCTFSSPPSSANLIERPPLPSEGPSSSHGETSPQISHLSPLFTNQSFFFCGGKGDPRALLYCCGTSRSRFFLRAPGRGLIKPRTGRLTSGGELFFPRGVKSRRLFSCELAPKIWRPSQVGLSPPISLCKYLPEVFFSPFLSVGRRPTAPGDVFRVTI